MEFYSHNYLIHRAATFDWTQVVLFVLVALLMIFSLIHYLRDRKSSKYRELALIALFSFILLGLLQLERVMAVGEANKHYESIVASQESIAQVLMLILITYTSPLILRVILLILRLMESIITF